jgi:hypothetical protein
MNGKRKCAIYILCIYNEIKKDEIMSLTRKWMEQIIMFKWDKPGSKRQMLHILVYLQNLELNNNNDNNNMTWL